MGNDPEIAIKSCRSCPRFDADSSFCGVRIRHEGKIFRLPVLPEDPCRWKLAQARLRAGAVEGEFPKEVILREEPVTEVMLPR